MKSIKQALKMLKPITPSKPSLKTLMNVKLHKGWIMGTDLDTWIRIKTDGIPEDITALISLQNLEKATKIKNLKSITFDADSQKIIFSGNIDLKVKTGDLRDYPELDPQKLMDQEYNGTIKIDNSHKIADYCSTDEARGVLMSVHYCAEESMFRATDGHRAEYGQFCGYSLERDVLIPAKVHKILDGKFKVMDNEKYTVLESPDTDVFLQKQGGNPYPDFSKILPKHNTNEVIMDRAELMSIIKEMLPFTHKRTNLIKFQQIEGQVILSSENREEDFSIEKALPAQTGLDSITIGYNAKYLLQVVADMGTKRIKFKFSDSPVGATLIEGMEDTPDALLMPLKILDEE